MNIHLPAILMFTRGTRFWHTAIWHRWRSSYKPVVNHSWRGYPSWTEKKASYSYDSWSIAWVEPISRYVPRQSVSTFIENSGNKRHIKKHIHDTHPWTNPSQLELNMINNKLIQNAGRIQKQPLKFHKHIHDKTKIHKHHQLEFHTKH